MDEKNQSDSEQRLEAPEKFAAALRESSRREIFVPGYVDRSVLEAARRHLASSEKTERSFFRFLKMWPVVAAACLVVAISCFFILGRSKSYAREDLNHDGRVDIMDSFALARQLKSGKALPAAFDVNGDGVVDEPDVISIATHAVGLRKDKRS